MADQGPAGRKTSYREVTIASIVFGVVVGAIMNAAITYAGLKIGFTIVGSSIAAVLGFGVLRGMLRKGSILEVNIGQTIASAVNTPNSGVIFTVPVLFLLGIPLVENKLPNTNFLLVTLACIAGAILGGAFIVPLRKQMLDIERLRFPSATAVGAILKSPGAGPAKSVLLILGILLSAGIAAPSLLPAITVTADIEQLDDLVAREKIPYEAKLRTEMISGWIGSESAPEPVVRHGALVLELRKAKDRLNALCAEGAPLEERRAVAAGIETLEQQVGEAQREALVIVSAGAVGGHRVTGYADELAVRAHQAALGEREWETLRDRATGWAVRPMFWGYSDLELRVAREVDEAGGTVDYAYDGIGNENAVLTVESDNDRNGRADLYLTDAQIDVGRIFGLPQEAQLIFAIAPFALGAGYLTGRAGLFVLAGGVLAYLVINPVLFRMGWMPATIQPHQAAGFGYSNINRPLGIGLLLGGALMGILASLPAIKEALKSIAMAGRVKGGSDELGLKVLLAAVAIAFVALFFAADFTGNIPVNTHDPLTGDQLCGAPALVQYEGYTLGFASPEIAQEWAATPPDARAAAVADLNIQKPGLLAGMDPHLRAGIIALVGALWIWFAGIIIAQCTGMTDWSPISGMALLTVVLVMVLAGAGNIIGAVLIGAALCVAITCAADMMADLKTGYIVGAVPKRQQTLELITTAIGPVITMGVLLVIAGANMAQYGVEIGPGTPTTAPQAQALQAVITGVQGGQMPYALYGFGALLGAFLGLGSFSGLGVLIGLSMYLPMIYIATYGVGCIINMGVGMVKGRRWAEEWGVPLAAGFIVGDALLGLGVNFVVLLQS